MEGLVQDAMSQRHPFHAPENSKLQAAEGTVSYLQHKKVLRVVCVDPGRGGSGWVELHLQLCSSWHDHDGSKA